MSPLFFSILLLLWPSLLVAQFADFTLFLNLLNSMSVPALRKFFQSPLASTLANVALSGLVSPPGAFFTLRSNHTLEKIMASTFTFIVQRGFTDPITSPDELGTCDHVRSANVSCYCAAFKYDPNALYWTRPDMQSRIDQIGSISAFGQNICYKDAESYAGFVKMLCSVSYPRCPSSAKRGDTIAYKQTVRVCRSQCERVSSHHQQSLKNYTIDDVALRNDPLAQMFRPIAEKICLAGTFFVDCNEAYYDGGASTCANFTTRIRNAAVYDGVTDCLAKSVARPAPPVCDAKDWLFGLASSFDNPPNCPNLPGVKMQFVARNVTASMLDGSQLLANRIAPAVRVSYTERFETIQYLLHMPTLSEAKSYVNAANGQSVFDPTATIDYDLRALQWSVTCGGVVRNRPTLVNYTTTFRNSVIVLTISLNDNDQSVKIDRDTYVVKAGALKFTLTLNNGFAYSNNNINRLVFTFGFQFAPFAGYNINLGVDQDQTDSDVSGLLTFESSSIALRLSVPKLYEHDHQFSNTTVRIDALAEPAAYFASRACPSGRAELTLVRFATSAVFDPDLSFVYTPPDTSDGGNVDIISVDVPSPPPPSPSNNNNNNNNNNNGGTTNKNPNTITYTERVAAERDSTSQSQSNNGGTVAAVAIVVVLLVVGALGVAVFVFRRKIMQRMRGGSE